MKSSKNLFSPNKIIIYSLLVLSFLTLNLSAYAQNQSSFAGVWLIDKARSDTLLYKDFKVTRTIKQTAELITIEDLFVTRTGEKFNKKPDTYSLNGKEAVKETDGALDKKSAKWSRDKKTLIIKNTRTVNGKVYGSTDTYSLNANGRIMTVVTKDVNPEEKYQIINVFNKK